MSADGTALGSRIACWRGSPWGSIIDEVYEVADGHTALHGMTEPLAATHEVVVAPPHPSALDDTGHLQIGDDLLDGTLGDPDPRGDIAEQHLLICSQTHEHVPVVREESPDATAHTDDVRSSHSAQRLIVMQQMQNGPPFGTLTISRKPPLMGEMAFPKRFSGKSLLL